MQAIMTTTAQRDSAGVTGAGQMRNVYTAARPTILFVAAFAFNVSPHEAVHAIVAYLLGFSSMLFQMWVNPDAASATATQVAAIAASAPIFSLIVGVAGWLIYCRSQRKPSALFFLMFAIVGIYSFLGPTAVAALGGDFHTALQALGVSKGIQYTASITGVVLLSTFMLFMGRELMGYAPLEFGRIQAVIATTVLPWIIGTLLTLVVFWPLPGFLVISAINGSVFWFFAVVGASLKARPVGLEFVRPSPTVRLDLIVTGLAVAMVRILTHGIRLAR